MGAIKLFKCVSNCVIIGINAEEKYIGLPVGASPCPRKLNTRFQFNSFISINVIFNNIFFYLTLNKNIIKFFLQHSKKCCNNNIINKNIFVIIFPVD